jgi:hypothetical protein
MSEFNFSMPGWESREKDLSVPVTETPGLTPMLIVGEFPSGPAFSPVLHKTPQSLSVSRGRRSNERLGGELRFMGLFHGHAILSTSNELRTVRVLGLSGYSAGPAWVLSSNGQALAILRSRGTIAGDGTVSFAATTVTATFTGDDLLANINLSITGTAGTQALSICLNRDAANYAPSVLGRTNRDAATGVFVEAIYPELIRFLAEDGATDAPQLAPMPAHRDFARSYRGAQTPWLVSQVRGSIVTPLVRFYTIADGDGSNAQVKFTIENIDPTRKTFDVLVRSFGDTEDQPNILESYRDVTLDENSSSYILNKMGGRVVSETALSYDLKSAYGFAEVAENIPAGSFPCGFEGYPIPKGIATGINDASPRYKTTVTEFDRPGRFTFGLSESAFDAVSRGRALDADHFRFAGNLTALNGMTSAGFHLDSRAELLTSNGTTGFAVTTGLLASTSDLSEESNILSEKRLRRFTVAPAGGFDGWNIYRTERTNSDAFSAVTGSDYHAWIKALDLLKNPLNTRAEAILTPGLNFASHLKLVNYLIEVIEEKRKDSVYLLDAPDLGGGVTAALDAAQLFAETGITSSYVAWHAPWVQDLNPEQNNSLVYVSPAGKQAADFALTDKVKAKWFAAAGQTRGAMPGIKRARLKVDEEDRKAIHASRGNAIVTFTGGQLAIYNNNTALPAASNSPLTSLNVRRGLLYLRRAIGEIVDSVIFDEQNDSVAVTDLTGKIDKLLKKMKDERGLFRYSISEVVPEDPTQRDRKERVLYLEVNPIEALENVGFVFGISGGSVSVTEGTIQ